MGQRSQLVIRYIATTGYGETQQHQTHRRATHFQWNWGPYMILRAAQAVNFARTFAWNRHYYLEAHNNVNGLHATFSVNQTTGDVQGLHPDYDVSEESIDEFDNDNGCFLMDVAADGEFTFGFLTARDLHTVVTAEDYFTDGGRNLEDYSDDPAFHQAVRDALDTLTAAEGEGLGMDQATVDALRPASRNARTLARG